MMFSSRPVSPRFAAAISIKVHLRGIHQQKMQPEEFLEVQEVSEKAVTGFESSASNLVRKHSDDSDSVAEKCANSEATHVEPESSEFAADWTERRYRELIDHSPHATVVHEAGRLVYVNPAAVRWIAATSADQLLGHPIAEFVQLASVPTFLVRLSALQNLGDASEPSPAVLTKFDGTTLDVEAISVLTRWEGRPAYQVVFRDIGAEKALEANVRLQAALLNAVSDAVIETTGDGTVTSWNPAAQLLYGRSAAEALNQPLRSMVGVRLDPSAIVAAGGVTYLDHRTVAGYARARVSVSATGSGFLIVIADQAASRRAELVESILDSLNGAVAVVDRQGNVTYSSAAAKNVLGIEPGEAAIPPAVGAFVAQLLDNRPSSGVDQSEPMGDPFDESILEISRGDGARIALVVNARLLDPANPGRSDIVLSFSEARTGRAAE